MSNFNRSSSYYSGGKRSRDSMLQPNQSTIRPFLMGSAGNRSPNKKRSRLSLGGATNRTSEVDWSSLLNFQTPLRPTHQRTAALRRRETIHSLPGQFGSPALSSPVSRGGVTNTSPGFFLRDRNERSSVARALKILDSRKRFRELSNNTVSDHDGEQQGEQTPYPVPNANRKRRRLTINGTLEQMLQEEAAFASTSLGEIASRSNSQSRPDNRTAGSSIVQKRIFTSSVVEPTCPSTEPSSKRSRPSVGNNSPFSVANVGTEIGDSRPGSSTNGSSSGVPQSDAAHRRRLLSYMAPETVEARYAKRSAATDLIASSRRSSRSATPSVTRRASQISNQVTTTGAQTEITCNRAEILQKSPVKSDEKKVEGGDDEKTNKSRPVDPPKRHAPLSVADFVAHLDRARTSPHPYQTEDTLRRTAADSQARRERLNRLRKLLSDVTQDSSTPPQVNNSTVNPSDSLGRAPVPAAVPSSVLSALQPPTSGSGPPKSSFGFVPSSAAPAAGTILGQPAVTTKSNIPGIAFGIKLTSNTTAPVMTFGSKTSNAPATVVQSQGPPASTSASTATVSQSSITAPTSAVSGIPPVLFGATSSAPTSMNLPNTSLANSTAPAFGFNPTTVPATNSLTLGQNKPVPEKAVAAPSSVLTVGQSNQVSVKTVTSQPSGTLVFSFGQSQITTSAASAPAPPAYSQLPQTSSVGAVSVTTAAASKDNGATIASTSANIAGNSFFFGKPTSASLAIPSATSLVFGQTKPSNLPQATVTPAIPSFGQQQQQQTQQSQQQQQQQSQPPQQQQQPTVAASTAGQIFSFGQPSQSSGAANTGVSKPHQFSFGNVSQSSNASAPNIAPFSFGQPSQTTSTNSSTVSSFPFGQPAGAATAMTTTTTTTTASTTPFNFGNNSQAPIKSSAPKPDSTLFGGLTTTTTASSTPFSFGQSSQFPQKMTASNSDSKSGVEVPFGQNAPKSFGSGATVSGGGLFSFTKSSDAVKTSEAPNQALFSFAATSHNGPSHAITSNQNGSSTVPAQGGFSFTNQQGNSIQSKPNTSGTSNSGLFPFGQTSSTSTKGLFGPATVVTASAEITKTKAVASASGVGFSFGTNASASSNSGLVIPATTSTPANVQPFTFGAVTANGNTAPSNTAATVFGSSTKTGFAFGQAPTATTNPASSGAFSFGTNQPSVKGQPQSVAPATNSSSSNKPNGGAGFTFHPPTGSVTAQPGSFTFGGASVGSTGPAATPFTFGQQQQQQQPPAPGSGNLFSQTVAAPRKKMSGSFRKRTTRK